MKNRFKSRMAVCVAVLLLAAVVFTAGAAAGTVRPVGEYLYNKLHAVAELVESDSIYSHPGDDPVKKAMIALFDNYPWMFDVLANMMLGEYDPYSRYYDEDSYQSSYGGQSDYVGIGVTVELNVMGVLVTAVARNSPAEGAGIRVGDYIVEANDIHLGDKNINEIAGILRGPEGTSVSVVLRRPGQREYIRITIQRQVVKRQTVFYTPMGSAAYILVTTFAPGTETEFAAAVDAAYADGAKAVIYDLRQNLGGDLETLIHMLGHVVPEKGVKMFGLRTREGEQSVLSPGGGRAFEKTVILCDKYTASSSEIFAYSLRDLGIATIIGAQTYGKGVGQGHFMFYDGSVVALTTIEATFPSGTTYHGKGIVPDIEAGVETKRYYEDLNLVLPPDLVLGVGDKTEHVGVLEYYLKILGFFAGEPDFDFDKATLAAYNDFQRLCGLELTQKTNRTTNIRLVAAAQYHHMNTYITSDRALEKALEFVKAR